MLFFEMWSRRYGQPLVSDSLVDNAMVQYFTNLLFDGESPVEGQNCLHGWLFHRTLEDGNRRLCFPTASRSLRGWTRRARGGAVDPVPFGVVAVLAVVFAESGLVRLAVFVLFGFGAFVA